MRIPLFRGKTRWGLLLLTLLLSSLLFAACGGNPSILNPAGPVAQDEANLFWFILGVATFVFVVVEGILIWSIIRFRERPGMPTPRQIHGNTTLEIVWTVAPSIFLFVVLVFTIRTMFQVDTIPTGGQQLEVTAVGHQWWWEFDYPTQKVITADDLVVPTGTVVHVKLYSNNVIHSFWVPNLTGKTDVVPGHDNEKWFSVDKPGTYHGQCAEYCGLQHANMAFNVIALPPDQFATWVSGQQQAAANNPQYARGLALFKSKGCTACHGIVGVNLNDFNTQPQTLVGPNLTHFGSRDMIAGGVLKNTPENLAKWLHDPQAVKPGNDMPNLGLSQSEVNDLVAYLESLK
ncbi:cytochrome c oxidase subunit II [Thermogemmatispora carboxidivorans]|uniref:cytochrome c oxidase subunit II n=1 Tax=Thermogemmatispora carboxidivorans TaxID=1382306 RepID=UPI000A79D361|nr:cytochrome c oxidase subunit II [Thermogemmatispora carboxidivorans]